MPENEEQEIQGLKGIHGKARKEAGKEMPELDITEIIGAVAEVYFAKENRSDIAQEKAKLFAEKYKKPADTYVRAFCIGAVEEALNKSKKDGIQKLAEEGFANDVVDTGKNIEQVVRAYLNGDMDEVALIKALSTTGIIDVVKNFLQASGITADTLKTSAMQLKDALPQVAVGMVSVCALAAAYKLLKEALNEAAITREEKIVIEKQCNESIKLMRQYRTQMNESISNYLCDYTETFNKGIAAMDQAILDGDINGFIRGNTEIQEILNYNVQFRNENEFDELMLSDTAFKL